MADEEIIDDEELDEGGDVGIAPSSGRSKLVTILLFVAGAIVAILLMVMISFWIAKSVKNDQYKEEQSIVIAPAPAPLSTYPFPKEFRVNTADVDEAHFIQLSLTLAYQGENKELEAELIKRQPQMMHVINIIIGGKKKEDLLTPLQRSNLAEEIKSQINMILRDGKIEDVYFVEIVVS